VIVQQTYTTMHPNTLADAVANAITFLTRPLILAYPPATLTKLQSVRILFLRVDLSC
jgi:hypothetical protein